MESRVEPRSSLRSSAASESKSQSPLLPTGRDVLVVEDEARIRAMLSQALKQMGFEASLVASAEAANRALAQRSYDILILDLNLPGLGGMEFLESLRRQKAHRDTQVIILTGFGDLEAARKAIHLDVVEFLTKPCTLGSLEVALDRARQRRRGQIINESAASAEPKLQFETAPAEPAPARADAAPAAGGSATLSLEDLEQQAILVALRKHGGNRAATAAELGISLRKLYYRLGEYQRKGLLDDEG